jgi:hypothetical protein
MKNLHRSVAGGIALWGIALLVPGIARAQRTPGRIAGGMANSAPERGFVRPVPSSTVRVNVNRTAVGRSPLTTSRGTQRHRADGSAFGGAGTGLDLQELLNITPNSGFNWQYVNSINQDLPLKALIDPVTQLEVAQAERLLRSTGGGVLGAYVLSGGYPYYYASAESEAGQSEDQGQQAQDEEPQAERNPRPQIIVVQQAPAQQPSAQAAEVPAEQEIPDHGELTLVLRSGKQIQALAFTRVNDKIVYITPDGGRSTIEAANLDPGATVRVNQERGTPLQLPL